MRRKRQAKTTHKDYLDCKRRKPTSPPTVSHVDISEEDRYLLKLKDEENRNWKDIIAKFAQLTGKTYRAEALQMRLKRVRDRLYIWSYQNVHALRMAHQFWEESKFEIIADKASLVFLCRTFRLSLI